MTDPRTAGETLVAELRQHLAEYAEAVHENLRYATEFRIPCPDPADPGRPAGVQVMRPEALIIQKVADHWAGQFPDGWSIHNPNLEYGDRVWTGTAWESRGQLHIGVIYRWTRDQAVAEAQRLAVEETARYETWLAEQRAGRESSG